MNVPELRFKEFKANWSKSTVLDFAPLQRGFDLPVSSIVEGDYPVVFSNGILKKHTQFKVIAPGVVTGRSGTIGNVTYVEQNYWPHNTALWVTDFKGNSPKFVYYFYTQFDLARFGTGSGVPTLNRNDVHREVIFTPSVEEQTKIANFLTAVDEKITQLTQKCELLAQYKKGVMQQIFSQELRFKDDDGQDFPEWESLRLSDIATRVTRKNKENNLNVLTISAQLGLINQEEYFNKSVAAKDVTNYFLLHHGDFAYNKSYSKGYPMGAIKCLNRYDKGVVSTLYICFKLNDEYINSFFEHYFEAGLQNAEIEKVAQEGARNHGLLNIGLDDFFSINLTVPSTAEQRKIANFLNAIDDKLTHTQNQLAAAKQYKQGLLQQMFV